MVKAFHYRRLLILGALLLGGLGWLAQRLYRIQIVRHEELRAKAERRFTFARKIDAIRGEIRDSKDRVLAIDETVLSVFVNPVLLGDRRVDMAQVLAFWAETDADRLAQRLKVRMLGVNSQGAPIFDTRVLIRKRVSSEEWSRLKRLLEGHFFGFDPQRMTGAHRSRLWRPRTQTVFAEETQIRIYPNGSLAAHVIGFVGATNSTDAPAGLSGIEAVLESELRGTSGWRKGERDVHGTEIPHRRWIEVPPVAGRNVVLSLDAEIQQILESELATSVRTFHAAGAAGVVVQPRTGRVLGMASVPSFNPEDLSVVDPAAWRNRVVADVYETGSTFKIVAFSAMIEERLSGLETPINCRNGRFDYHGTTLTERPALGTVTCEQAFAVSSSIAAAQLGLLLGPERMHKFVCAFGFGSPTGIQLPFERAGTVFPPSEWSVISPTRVAIGYEIGVTAIQMVMAMSALANQGRLMRPILVDRIEDATGKVLAQSRPEVVRQVVRPATAAEMVRALKGVVSTGTGRLAALEGIPVAGKTGTAWKAGARGYDRERCTASFCGFLPADAPEVCILVVLDEPKPVHAGGRTSGPTFRNIAARIANNLQIPDTGSRLAAARPALAR